MKQFVKAFGCKKFLPCILTICVLLSSVLTIPIFVKAESNPQKMLKLEGRGAYLYQIPNVDMDAQYKAYFKYSVESGNFSIADNSTIRFAVRYNKNNLYQYKLTASYYGEYAFDTMDAGEDGWSDLNVTFTPHNDTNANHRVNLIGFELTQQTVAYVADFKLYKIKDGTEELVKEGFDGFENKNVKIAGTNYNNVTVSQLDYDESRFKDVMLNIKGGKASESDSYYKAHGNYTMQLPSDSAGRTFKVYFKYKTKKGIFGADKSATCRFVTYWTPSSGFYLQNTTHDPLSAEYGFTEMTDGEDGWSDISLTFTTKNNGKIQIGFLFNGETEIDVADFHLYVIENNQEKLVDTDFDAFVSRNPKIETIVTKSAYNSEMFKDTMTKINAKIDMRYDMIISQLDSSKQYKAYFKYYMPKGVFGTSDNRTIIFTDKWKGQFEHHASHFSDGEYAMVKGDGLDGISDISLSWTTKEAGDHYIGMRFRGDTEIYIADFRLYVIENGEERLIQIGTEAFKDRDSGVVVSEEPCDNALFEDRMLHINAGEQSRFNMRITAKEGDQYKIYMQHSVQQGVYGASSAKNTLGVSAMLSGRYTHYSTHNALDPQYAFISGDGKEGVSDLELTFTVKDGNTDNDGQQAEVKYNVGWWFRNPGDIYIYNFRLYKIVNGEEILTDIDLSNFVQRDYSSGNEAKGLLITEYLPYDETLFIENAVQLFNETYENNAFGTNVSLKGGKEYKLSFLSFYLDGMVRHDKINIVVREALGKSLLKKTYFTTDELDSSAEQFKVNEVTASLVEYTFTAPADGEYSVAIEMYGKMHAYFADFKLVDTADSEVNLLANGDFSKNLSGWYSENMSAGIGASAFYDSFVAETFTCSSARYKELFDKELLPQQMLYFKLGSGGMRRWLLTQIDEPKVGETWHVQFKVGGASSPYYCVAANSGGNLFSSSCTRLSIEWFDDYYVATYEVKVPAFAENGQEVASESKPGIKVGLLIHPNTQSCLLEAKAWKADDETKTNVMKNGTFKYGLADWGFFFENNLSNIPNDEKAPYKVFNDSGSVLEVMDHDVSKYELFLDDSRFDDGEWWSSEDVFEDDNKVTSATVSGKLVDQNDKALSGVKLVLASEEKLFTATTTSDGSFVFKAIPESYYTLYMIDNTGKHRETGFASGVFDKDIANVKIVCDSSAMVEETEPEPQGSVNGTVYTPALKTVSNLPVYIGNYSSVVTDQNGLFAFSNIPVGEYELYTVSKSGDKYIFRTVTVKEDVDVGVKLKFDPPTSTSNTNADSFSIWWIIIPVIALILIAGGITAFVLIKKKKSKS